MTDGWTLFYRTPPAEAGGPKLKKHERVCNDHDYCSVEMPNKDNKILKYNQGEKSLKPPAIIFADLQCLLEKMHSCQNNH